VNRKSGNPPASEAPSFDAFDVLREPFSLAVVNAKNCKVFCGVTVPLKVFKSGSATFRLPEKQRPVPPAGVNPAEESGRQ
jgi:hypothetical protein